MPFLSPILFPPPLSFPFLDILLLRLHLLQPIIQLHERRLKDVVVMLPLQVFQDHLNLALLVFGEVLLFPGYRNLVPAAEIADGLSRLLVGQGDSNTQGPLPRRLAPGAVAGIAVTFVVLCKAVDEVF
jgi:hypothetical protein